MIGYFNAPWHSERLNCRTRWNIRKGYSANAFLKASNESSRSENKESVEKDQDVASLARAEEKARAGPPDRVPGCRGVELGWLEKCPGVECGERDPSAGVDVGEREPCGG